MTIARQIRPWIWIVGAAAASLLGLRGTASPASTLAPTFNKEVAPILFKRCVSCHRPGEGGSAVWLVSYETASPWAESIKKKVVRREMPPWPADPNHSLKFRNDPRLSQQEIDTLVAWVDAGAPRGDDADLPPLPDASRGWQNPKGIAPDEVIQLPLFHLPATGEIPYVKYLAKVPFPVDKWVVALQVLPSNRAVVHHMAITEVALDPGLTPADLDKRALIAQKLGLPSGSVGSRPAVVDPANESEPDMLGVYTPGTTFESYGDGSAKLLRSGENMYLNFNIHYQTSGKTETDQPKLGLWFQPDPPKHQLFRVPASGETIIANGGELLTDTPGEKAEGTSVVIPPIPPYAENYELVAVTAYTEPVTIYQLQPHAHLRGKDFKYAVVYPDGREVDVLSVPKYDFHWQLAYELDRPLELPAGSKLVVTAHYDNSLQNEHLQHHHNTSDAAHFGPDREVYFREANQSWDEMFTPFIQYSIDIPAPTTPAQPQPSKHEAGSAVPPRGMGEQSALHSPLHSALQIAEVVGCLEESSPGMWLLTHAGEPAVSETQTTSMAAVRAAAAKPLGSQRDQLLGLEAFNPAGLKGQKVVVKGALIKSKEYAANQSRLNVTSLQTIASKCF